MLAQARLSVTTVGPSQRLITDGERPVPEPAWHLPFSGAIGRAAVLISANPYEQSRQMLDSVREHIGGVGGYVAEIHQISIYERVPMGLESPLEAVFWMWWDALRLAGEIAGTIILQPQQRVVTTSGRVYRLDFQAVPTPEWMARAAAVDVPIQRIAIEIDGHEFHERTKEQVIHRNQRDRDLQTDGWTLLHFSGSEIHRQPKQCVWQVQDVAYAAFGFRFEREIETREIASQVGRT